MRKTIKYIYYFFLVNFLILILSILINITIGYRTTEVAILNFCLMPVVFFLYFLLTYYFYDDIFVKRKYSILIIIAVLLLLFLLTISFIGAS